MPLQPPIRVCGPDQVPDLLPAALAGDHTLVPLADGADPEADLAWLRPELPEPGAAVIVTTSGSTGVPKGVCLSADALLAGAAATQSRLGGPMTWWSPLPLHHVAGLMTAVRAHLAGTAVEVLDAHLDGLPPIIGPTAVSLVPTQLHRALRRPDLLAVLARCEAVLIGGAAADPAELDRAREAGLAVVTTYGMSETCGGCVYDGRPLDGVRVEVGEGGRIAIGGPVVFNGYRLAPELTARTLVAGAVVTRDRGRWEQTTEGPRLRVLGRIDDVVISGGVNVDLAAVGRHVQAVAHGWQGEAVVLGVPDREWGTAVVLVGTEGHDADTWRAALRERGLSGADLPVAVQQVGALPRTGSGKIDRVWLADHFAASSVRSARVGTGRMLPDGPHDRGES